MDIKLLVSFNAINDHIRNCRRLTPAMLNDINRFNDFHKLKVIETYDEMIETLLEHLETVHEVSNLKYPLNNKEPRV